MNKIQVVDRPLPRKRGSKEHPDLQAILDTQTNGKAVLIQINGRKSARSNLIGRFLAKGIDARTRLHTQWADDTHTAFYAWLDPEASETTNESTR